MPPCTATDMTRPSLRVKLTLREGLIMLVLIQCGECLGCCGGLRVEFDARGFLENDRETILWFPSAYPVIP